MIHRVIPAFAAAVLVAVLAACTAASPVPKRSVQLPSPRPSPSAIAPASPQFAFDIGCAGLLRLEEAQAHIAVPVTLDVDETRPQIVDLPLAQIGGLTCIWGGSDRTDGGYGQGVQLRMLPNAATEFAAWTATKPPAYCVGGPSPVFCTADFLVGATWVELQLEDLTAADSTDPKATAAEIQGLVTERLAGAASRRTWSPRGSALQPIADCARGTAGAAAALGTAAGPLHQVDDTLDPTTRASLYGVIVTRAGVSLCGWENGDGSATLTWEVLPGGSWAFDGFDRPQQLGLIGDFRHASVPGAVDAWIGCADSCAVLLDVHDSLVTLFTDEGTSDEELTARAAHAILAFAG